MIETGSRELRDEVGDEEDCALLALWEDERDLIRNFVWQMRSI